MKLLQTLVIPEYITRIQLSKSQRSKYFQKVKKKGKIIIKPRAIPKKYQNDEYAWGKDNFFYHKATREKVIANPNAAGTPKWHILSGNEFKSGFESHHIRNKAVISIKEFYYPFINDQLKKFEKFPLRISWTAYICVDDAFFDVSNLFFYYTYLEDALQDCKKIPNDDFTYITQPAAPRLLPAKSYEDRKFVFKFYLDDDPEITSHEGWAKHRRVSP